MTTPTKAEIDELIVFWSSQTYPRLEPPSQWATMIDKTIAALQAMKSDGMKAPKIERWLNIYDAPYSDGLFKSEEDALRNAKNNAAPVLRVAIHLQEFPATQTVKYPCRCSASPIGVPNYCPVHSLTVLSFSRGDWHNATWNLYHELRKNDASLGKFSVHTLRTILDTSYDAMIAAREK